MANGKIEKREEQHLHQSKKAKCNKDDDYSLLLMYMSRMVQKRVWKAYSLRRSRQESLEEEEQRNRHNFCWRSRKESLEEEQRNRHYFCWRSRQESLEEEEQRNRHYLCWRERSGKRDKKRTRRRSRRRSWRREEVAAGGTNLEDEQSSFTTRIATAQQDEYDCDTLCAKKQTLFFCVRKRPCFVCP
jgi:hypothetical protein